jgi:hypothetical protein
MYLHPCNCGSLYIVHTDLHAGKQGDTHADKALHSSDSLQIERFGPTWVTNILKYMPRWAVLIEFNSRPGEANQETASF